MKVATGLVAIAAAVLAAGTAQAASYPDHPVKIVVPFAPAGPTDVMARLIGQKLSESLKQQFYVENHPGAGGNIGMVQVAKSAPDGYTILVASSSFVVNPSLYAKNPYDPFKDFAPVSNAANLPMVIVTAASSTDTSMKDLIARAKARPGEISYGTSGIGGSSHLAGAMLENFTGTKMINVPFKGNGPALAEVMAGRVSFMFYPIVGIADQVAAKKIKVLAVGTPQPHPDFPGVPTMEQSGLPGFEETAPWVGMLAPAGTPAPVVARLSEEMRKSIAKPETKERFKSLGAVPIADTPAEFAAFLKKDYDRWARVIKASGVKAE